MVTRLVVVIALQYIQMLNYNADCLKRGGLYVQMKFQEISHNGLQHHRYAGIFETPGNYLTTLQLIIQFSASLSGMRYV